MHRNSRKRTAVAVVSAVLLFVILRATNLMQILCGSATSENESADSDTGTSTVPMLRDSKRPGYAVASPDRITDVTDAFQNYTRHPHCNVSSLDLHDPFHPLCSTKRAVLDAMSGGGRSGLDMPFIPRGCDMRWFSQAEICELLSRFSTVTVGGDSMMRNLAIAMNVFLRKDLDTGTLQNWIVDGTNVNCRCSKVFTSAQCWNRGAWSGKMVWRRDPESMWCSKRDTANIEYNLLLAYPIENDARGLTSTLPNREPQKPHVFVLGHGLWNDVNETASFLWLEQVQRGINKTMPWLTRRDAVYPRLFVTPSCAGLQKPEQYVSTQGNMQLARFEMAMGPALRERGFDHLGTFNLTVQNTSPDGTHAGFHANLVKAMMVFNWMSWIDVGSRDEMRTLEIPES